ncbi:hypothetical protein GF380_05315 [Candidatus Uhrbacteria bacterium]|nr:hypothetical protein [Candidatus Uhrbacteria bacterium]MBD3284449.1 hypothetical protein [Candidatus Uhrbacteria bacterium]
MSFKLLSAVLLSFMLLGAGCATSAPSSSNPSLDQTTDVMETGSVRYVLSSDQAFVATLHLIEDAEVTVERAGQTFEGVQDLQVAYGDRIIVDKGEAVLAYHEPGITYLFEGTEVLVTFPILGDTEPGQHQDFLWLRIQMFAGRSWTRIEKLLDLTDTHEVGAGNVIATVRGTAYDFRFEDGHYKLVVGGRTVNIVHRDDFAKRVVVTGGNTFEATEEQIGEFLELDHAELQAAFVKPSSPEDLSSDVGAAMLQMIPDEWIDLPEEPVFLPVEPQISEEAIGELQPAVRAQIVEHLELEETVAEEFLNLPYEGMMIEVDMGGLELLGQPVN